MNLHLQALLTRKAFAFAVAFLGWLATVLMGEMFVQGRERDAQNQRQLEMVSYTATVRARIENELSAVLYLSSGLGGYLIVRNDMIEGEEIQAILAVLHRNSRHVRNFGVSRGLRLTYVYPVEGNEKAIGLYYPDQPDQWPIVQRVIEQRTPALAGPLQLAQGGSGLIYRVPLFIDEQYWGLLSTVIDADSLFTSVAQASLNERYEFALRGRDGQGAQGEGIWGDQTLFTRSEAVVQQLAVPGGSWAIAVAARELPGATSGSLMIRLGSFLFGVVLGWLLYVLLRHRAELAHLVLYDSLTNLPNRRLFEDRVQMALARQQRAPDQWCALLFLDLDGFKAINDLHGHKAGDAVLQETARRAGTAVRSNDTVARWGGDEFIVLLENVSEPVVTQLIERLRQAIEVPVPFEGQSLRVGVSIGQNLWSGNGADFDALLKMADERMYTDKTARKATTIT